MGKHVVEQRIANAHMVQYKCKTCGLRMMCVPRHGSSGKYRAQTPLTVHEEPTKEQIEKYTGIVEEKPTEVKLKTKKVAILGEPIWDGKEETKKEYLKELFSRKPLTLRCGQPACASDPCGAGRPQGPRNAH